MNSHITKGLIAGTVTAWINVVAFPMHTGWAPILPIVWVFSALAIGSFMWNVIDAIADLDRSRS